MAGKYGLGYDDEAHYDTGESSTPSGVVDRPPKGQTALFGEDQRGKRKDDSEHSDDAHRLKPGLAQRRR